MAGTLPSNPLYPSLRETKVGQSYHEDITATAEKAQASPLSNGRFISPLPSTIDPQVSAIAHMILEQLPEQLLRENLSPFKEPTLLSRDSSPLVEETYAQGRHIFSSDAAKRGSPIEDQEREKLQARLDGTNIQLEKMGYPVKPIIPNPARSKLDKLKDKLQNYEKFQKLDGSKRYETEIVELKQEISSILNQKIGDTEEIRCSLGRKKSELKKIREELKSEKLSDAERGALEKKKKSLSATINGLSSDFAEARDGLKEMLEGAPPLTDDSKAKLEKIEATTDKIAIQQFSKALDKAQTAIDATSNAMRETGVLNGEFFEKTGNQFEEISGHLEKMESLLTKMAPSPEKENFESMLITLQNRKKELQSKRDLLVNFEKNYEKASICIKNISEWTKQIRKTEALSEKTDVQIRQMGAYQANIRANQPTLESAYSEMAALLQQLPEGETRTLLAEKFQVIQHIVQAEDIVKASSPFIEKMKLEQLKNASLTTIEQGIVGNFTKVLGADNVFTQGDFEELPALQGSLAILSTKSDGVKEGMAQCGEVLNDFVAICKEMQPHYLAKVKPKVSSSTPPTPQQIETVLSKMAALKERLGKINFDKSDPVGAKAFIALAHLKMRVMNAERRIMDIR